MTMKRNREGEEEIAVTANYMLLLSSRRQVEPREDSSVTTNRVFTCKTCDRKFESFQALGGHRASHKKSRLVTIDGGAHEGSSPPKSKTHECSICGLNFPIGQALGGHMRRHRANTIAGDDDRFMTSTHWPKKSMAKDSMRVLWLDLNLTPLENKLVFGKVMI